MDTKLFWQLMEDICQLGEFIADMEIKGAETNIRGTLQVGYDGLKMVLERLGCHDHIHLAPEYIQTIHFGYYQVSTGRMDPCIELINVDDQVCLTLLYYPYQVSELKQKHKQFIERNQPYRNYLTGEW